MTSGGLNPPFTQMAPVQRSPEYLLEVARRTAWGAADILLDYYRRPLKIRQKNGGPVTDADLAADRFILSELRSACGNEAFAYLSEETIGGLERFERPFLWVVDPLDGTRDFIDHTGEFAVHIALVESGRPVLAAVAWPVRERVYFARKGCGAYSENRAGVRERLQVSQISQLDQCRIIVSRVHRDWRLDALLARLPKRERIVHGGLGCKLCAIAAGEAEMYVGLSGRSAPCDWDLAAPQIVLTEAGGAMSRFDGGDLLYNQPDLHLWGGLIADNGVTHGSWCKLLPDVLSQVEQLD